ncbi:tripartite tricarboxylate transporter substrate-binding protein [Phytohabitans kaempferiae]|uniref:Tripartite tricarboxylate transporter substrate-binding protein n=1 Tax=Phytohabitans kaempferiae TaxID=1620943 RepID=A0ABV6M9S8_9ACTN
MVHGELAGARRASPPDEGGVALQALGQRIRVYRSRQRQLHVDRPWTQEDLAVAIGSDKAHINRIECGRQRPALDTLNRISEALDLAWADRSRLLRLAGYLLTPPAPGSGEIAEMARRVGRVVHDTPHPALLIDQENRIWDVNHLFACAFLSYPDRDACLAEVRGRRIVELLGEGHQGGEFLRRTLHSYPAFVRQQLMLLRRDILQRPASAELSSVLDAVLADRRLCAAWLALSAHLPQGDEPDYLDHQTLRMDHPSAGQYTVQVWQSTLAADERFGVVHLVPADDTTRQCFARLGTRHTRPGWTSPPPTPPRAAAPGIVDAGHRDSPTTRREAFPNRPITLTVPWAAGGVTDVGARILAPLVAQELDQAVVVVNDDDAQSRHALKRLARQPADGYHLAFLNQPALDITLPQGRSRFVLVANQAFDPIGVFVRADSRYGNLRDLVRDAARRPGQVTVGTSGPYTPAHLGALLLEQTTGISFRFIHYCGSMEHIARFLAGQTDVAFFGSGITVPALRADELRALAMFTEERFPLLPEVVTAAEGGFDGLVLASIRGVWAPDGVPAGRLRTLRAAFQAAMDNPAHLRQMHAAGLGVRRMTHDEYAAYVERQSSRYAGLLSTFAPAG